MSDGVVTVCRYAENRSARGSAALVYLYICNAHLFPYGADLAAPRCSVRASSNQGNHR
jgi:hypothetical protein